MSGEQLSSKLAVILHADVAGSTILVRENEQLAHERIQDTFQHFSKIIIEHQGRVHELRGDALLAEFERASDAVSAALELQVTQHEYNAKIDDTIKPEVRVGVALGEVIIADGTITGAGVVLAQRLEQLSKPGGVVIQGAAYETIPERFPFEYASLGNHQVKGFDEAIRAYEVTLSDGKTIPPSQAISRQTVVKISRNQFSGIAAILIIVALTILYWLKPWEAQTEPLLVEQTALQQSGIPSIAVLPFTNISNNPEQEYFVDGITEDIITDLSRLSKLRVLARNTSFKYKGQIIDLKKIVNELGVSHILEGSIRRTGNNLRITSRLIDSISGESIWAERFDKQLDDVFKVQDDVTQSIVSSLSIKLTGRDKEVLAQPTTSSFAAYDLFLQGQSLTNERTKEANLQAQKIYQKAIELDSGYARAYGALAVTLSRFSTAGYSESPEETKKQALELALKAVKLDSKSQHTYWALGFTYLYLHEFEMAAEAVRAAMVIAPNYADGLGLLALIKNRMGLAEESIKLIDKAILLNPYYTWDYLYNLGFAHYTLENYEKASEFLQEALERNENARPARLLLAASYVGLNRLDDAEWEIEEILSQNPMMSISFLVKGLFFGNEDKMNIYVAHLRKAGLPE
jgi:adenylate cyclase